MRTVTRTLWLAMLCAMPLAATDRFVAAAGSIPLAPYTNWSAAAATIQAALDIAQSGDTILVSNGVYATGQTLAPETKPYVRVLATNGVTIRSLAGPAHTLIVGQGPLATNAVRCVYLLNGALHGFTLSNGHTAPAVFDIWYGSGGGGAYASILTNCIITHNYSATEGGGVDSDSVCVHCVLTHNAAPNFGGGACLTWLNRCVVASNTAGYGGGIFGGSAYNSLLLDNTASLAAGGAENSALYNCTIARNNGPKGGAVNGTALNCIIWGNTGAAGANVSNVACAYTCTTPLQVGTGNHTNDPGLVDMAAGNCHLALSSPCINSGSNAAALQTMTDLDGNPRRAGPAIDLGCYEVVPEPWVGMAVLFIVMAGCGRSGRTQ
jgi:hypothetical protein